ncbi:MAG: hypothetical protein AAFQ82_20195, partial [Myxococcota bacterium]
VDVENIDNNLISPTLVLGSENNAVDTTVNICLEGDECTTEQFTAHFAWLTIRNDQIPDGSVNVGPDVANFYRVEFFPELVDFPLNTFDGSFRAAVGPGETVTTPITLVPFEVKSDVSAISDTPLTYRVRVTVEGRGGLEMVAWTTLLIGQFNNCPAESTALPIELIDLCFQES